MTSANYAEYRTQSIQEYEDNPFIEALPEVNSVEQAVHKTAFYPRYSQDDRLLEPHIRQHLLLNAFRCYQPLTLTIDIEDRLSKAIRQGYLSRNIDSQFLAQGYTKDFCDIKHTDYKISAISSEAYGFSVIGISGIGKTAAIKKVLSLYPQVINHTEYQTVPLNCSQITFLMTTCPFDGSVKGLILDILLRVDNLVGSHYYEHAANTRATTDQLTSVLNNVVRSTNIGVLIIDEIQNLSLQKSGGAYKMLNLLVNLINNVGVPVILVGTPKSQGILQSEFRQARRGIGIGGDLIIDRMKNDGEWDVLVKALWKYQYTRHETLLSQKILDALYDECQGITDLLKKLLVLSQSKAISSGKETVTPELIHRVAESNFKLVKPFINALRNNNMRTLSNLGDICLDNIDITQSISQSRNLKEDLLEQIKGNTK